MYQVVFNGEIAEGKDVLQVKQNLAALHKVPVFKIEPLFSGNQVVVKKGAERNIAVAVKAAYERAGAICTIEPSKRINIPLEISKIICPKCKFEQPEAAVCSSCGVIIDKCKTTTREKATNSKKKEKKLLAQVVGKPAKVSLGTVVPAFWGTTKLELYSNRIVERTKRIVSSNHTEMLTSEIDSTTIAVRGNPVWLAIGIVALSILRSQTTGVFFGIFAFLLCLIFLVLYFTAKYKFLIILSGSHSMTVSIIGKEEPYYEFKDALLRAAEEAKCGNIPR
jgi:hypothetical protein